MKVDLPSVRCSSFLPGPPRFTRGCLCLGPIIARRVEGALASCPSRSAAEPDPTLMAYVLVVDDNGRVRNSLRQRLERSGYAAKEASNAAEALELMLSEPASIVLLDIRMPGHDGFWLAERIHARWPRTRIIMVSGSDDAHTVDKSRRLGAVDYIHKPFDRELLRQALHRASSLIEDSPAP
jgi:two-component system chemotaxis response regulator CheY